MSILSFPESLASEDRFSFDERVGFRVEIPDGESPVFYPRASVAQLRDHLFPPVRLTRAGHLSTHQPAPKSPRPFGFWLAQLLHYGCPLERVQPLTTLQIQAVLKRALQGGTLRVPQDLKGLERRLRTNARRRMRDQVKKETARVNHGSSGVKSAQDDGIVKMEYIPATIAQFQLRGNDYWAQDKDVSDGDRKIQNHSDTEMDSEGSDGREESDDSEDGEESEEYWECSSTTLSTLGVGLLANNESCNSRTYHIGTSTEQGQLKFECVKIPVAAHVRRKKRDTARESSKSGGTFKGQGQSMKSTPSGRSFTSSSHSNLLGSTVFSLREHLHEHGTMTLVTTPVFDASRLQVQRRPQVRLPEDAADPLFGNDSSQIPCQNSRPAESRYVSRKLELGIKSPKCVRLPLVTREPEAQTPCQWIGNEATKWEGITNDLSRKQNFLPRVESVRGIHSSLPAVKNEGDKGHHMMGSPIDSLRVSKAVGNSPVNRSVETEVSAGRFPPLRVKREITAIAAASGPLIDEIGVDSNVDWKLSPSWNVGFSREILQSPSTSNILSPKRKKRRLSQSAARREGSTMPTNQMRGG